MSADNTRTLAVIPAAPQTPSLTGPLAATDDPAPGPPAAADAPAGYELRDEVGRGGMGVVYRAWDVAVGRDVAVKLLADRYPADGPAARRFLAEARITGQLQHPGIPAVHQVGRTPAGRPFLAMKLVKGETLADRLAGCPDRGHLLGVFEKVCEAVGYAHAHNVIHRDLKPANVMVGAHGEVQVMDWGLAKLLGRPADAADPDAADPDAADPDATAGGTKISSRREESDQTQDGQALGTPAYMPPEQAVGAVADMDRQSDVFGLGAVLCAMLTGKPPYVGADAGSTRQLAARAKLDDAFARLADCGADPGWAALCRRCLSPDKPDRPADAGAVATEAAGLRRAADERARAAEVDRERAVVRRRLTQRAAGAVAAVLLLGLAGTAAGLWRADAARRRAEAAEVATADQLRETEAARGREAEQRAAAEAARAEAVANEKAADATVRFFKDRVFAAGRPKGQDGGLGREVTLRAAVEASLPALAKGFADQPLAEARLREALGLTFKYLGDAKTAAEQEERARELYARHRGPDHPATLGSLSDLATSYNALGRHADALRLREECLAAFRRVLGPDHPDTLLSLNNLAENYKKLDRHADALRLNEECLAAFRRLRGPDHPDTLLSFNNVADAYNAVGRSAEAIEYSRTASDTARTVLGADHPSTLMYACTFAESLAGAGRSGEAVPVIDDLVTRAAGKPVLPVIVPTALDVRLRHFQRLADPAGCRATAGMWEGQDRAGPGDLLTAARMRAVAAGLYAKADQPAEAAADADRAMAWLTKAVAAGYRNRNRLATDADLAPLGGRADLRKLLGSLPERAPPPRPAQ